MIPPFILKAIQEFAGHAIKKMAHSHLDKHLEHAPPPRPLSETERQYLINKTQCDQLSVQLQHDQNQLQAARLELDRQRAQLELTIQREQLDWQKQSHQAQIEQSKQQIQADFDQNRWAGIWSRDELFTILQNSAQHHHLLLLLSEPKITDNCPDTFKHDLPTDVPNELKVFMQHHYPFDHAQPVQFFGRFFEKSVFDSHVKQYENLLRDSVPTVVLYSEMSSSKLYLHSHAWGFGEHALNETCMLNWSEAVEQFMADGMSEKRAYAAICKIIIDLYAAFAGFYCDLYYLHIDPLYQPRLLTIDFDDAAQAMIEPLRESLKKLSEEQRQEYEAALATREQLGQAQAEKEAAELQAKEQAEREQAELERIYQLGEKASKQNNHREAVKYYRQAAEAGYAKAQLNLGIAYKLGTGVSKDLNQAVDWIRKAAEQGHAEAQNILGDMYRDDKGIGQNINEALNWYLKAAKQNHRSSWISMGNIYCYDYKEVYHRYNYEEAAHCYRKAAELNHKLGQFYLGEMYEKGRGVNQDIEEAVRWYRKAAAQGYENAKKRLERLGRT